MENGTIVEDGHGPRWRAMLDAERAIREEFWESAEWRRLRLDHGHLTS
jgi:hypothetical protein